MANLTSKVMGFGIDNSGGSLTDISAFTNNQALRTAITILDDTAVGDTQGTRLYGVIQPPNLTINGFINTTTEGIFGPIVASGTGTSKTVSFKSFSTAHYTGEMLVSDVEISGASDQLQVWSATLIAEAGLTRTSVNPVS